jgi:hypothetical protein
MTDTSVLVQTSVDADLVSLPWPALKTIRRTRAIQFCGSS